MSRIYIHSRKYRKRSRPLLALVLSAVVLVLAFAGSKLYSKYTSLSQSPEATVSSLPTAMIGYINPYFLFRDSGKWVQDKSQTSASEVVYYQYVNGTAVRQLAVYINKTPTVTQLASNRVLPVKVVGGDSLSAGSLSAPCAAALPAGQKGVKEITLAGTTMVCDPGSAYYSVVLAEQGGSYQLHLTKSKQPISFVILYKDYSGQPNAGTVINIANSFKAI